jgi:hypothetical protein
MGFVESSMGGSGGGSKDGPKDVVRPPAVYVAAVRPNARRSRGAGRSAKAGSKSLAASNLSSTSWPIARLVASSSSTARCSNVRLTCARNNPDSAASGKKLASKKRVNTRQATRLPNMASGQRIGRQ